LAGCIEISVLFSITTCFPVYTFCLKLRCVHHLPHRAYRRPLKRQTASRANDSFDLTLLLLIANAVQNAMTGPDASLAGGTVAAGTLLVVNYLVAELAGANRRFGKGVEGQPSLLVHDGQVITAELAKEHVSMDELERAIREQGINSYHDVRLPCSR
jgi:Protein of unknown function (DUF421)